MKQPPPWVALAGVAGVLITLFFNTWREAGLPIALEITGYVIGGVMIAWGGFGLRHAKRQRKKAVLLEEIETTTRSGRASVFTGQAGTERLELLEELADEKKIRRLAFGEYCSLSRGGSR